MLSHSRHAVTVSLLLSLLAGCAADRPAVVPEQMYVEIQASDRERNYDLGWQDVARLNGGIERGEGEVVGDNALRAVARIARLESGEPERLDDRATASLLDDYRAQWSGVDESTLWAALRQRGPQLRVLFDAGDFEDALMLGLEILVLSDLLIDGPAVEQRELG